VTFSCPGSGTSAPAPVVVVVVAVAPSVDPSSGQLVKSSPGVVTAASLVVGVRLSARRPPVVKHDGFNEEAHERDVLVLVEEDEDVDEDEDNEHKLKHPLV
jgi:hypothetical protein